jgi:hypothetical protein
MGRVALGRVTYVYSRAVCARAQCLREGGCYGEAEKVLIRFQQNWFRQDLEQRKIASPIETFNCGTHSQKGR